MAGTRSRESNPAGIGTVHVTADHLIRLEGRTRGLTFLPRQARRSILAGRHASRVRGRGLNFEEIRGYLPGDDTRHIDWKVTLRTGRPSVRAFTEERDRPAIFVVDQRLSMFFGSRRAMKSVIAAELAVLGAFLVLRAGDRVGAVVFDESGIERIRPHRSRARVEQIVGTIARFDARLDAAAQRPAGEAQLDRALEGTLQLAAHDHLVCVISDFAGAGEHTRGLLRQLAAHNDVIAMQVYDPLVRETSANVRLVVGDGELQVELDVGVRRVRQSITSMIAGRFQAVSEMLRSSGVPLMMFDTEADTVDQLRLMLGRLSAQRVQGASVAQAGL